MDGGLKQVNILSCICSSAYKESFRFFDRSGKGYITPDDFRRALTQIQEGTPPREDEVADLMREYDINGN